MKRLFVAILLITSACQEEITPLTPHNNNRQLWVSSSTHCEFNIVIEVGSQTRNGYYHCNQVQAVKFSNLPIETVYYHATAGALETSGEVSLTESLTQLTITF